MVPRQRREGDTAQARADKTMAELKAGIRVVQAVDPDEIDGGDGQEQPPA